MREFGGRHGGSGSTSRPINLDLHTYRHQEHFMGNNSNNFHNKENLHRQQQCAGRLVSSRPSSYYPQPPSRLHRTAAGGHPSTSSGRFSKPIDLDAFSNSSISDDEDYEDDRDFDAGALVGARHTFYSTSDLTSDSEICGRMAGRYYAAPMVIREKGLRTKFPSLSTIYPDNSLIEEQYMDTQLLCYRNSERGPERNRPLHSNLSSSLSNTPPKTARSLEMIQEISPVLPPPDTNDDLDLPPVIQPLKLSKEWKPIQTSTMTNVHHPQFPTRFPKTNPRHPGMASTPRPLSITKANGNTRRQQSLASAVESPPPPRSLFDPHYQDLTTTCVNIRSEQYNLPTQLAKQFDIKGILFLNITIVDSTMIVTVKNAAYFLNGRPPVSSCVKVEITRTKSSTYRKRTKYESRFKSFRTRVVPQSNQPDFYEEFKFRISQVHLKLSDKLCITVYATGANDSSNVEYMPREILGRMSFPLRKLFRKANLYDYDSYGGDEILSHDPVKVCDGGYFLLPGKTGSERYFSQDSILHRKYYDEIGGGSTTMSTTSSVNSGSPFKMMNEPTAEWHHAAPLHHGVFKVQPSANEIFSGRLPSSSATTNRPVLTNSCQMAPPTTNGLLNFHSISNRLGSIKKADVASAAQSKEGGRKYVVGLNKKGIQGATMNNNAMDKPSLLDYTTTGSSSSNSGVEYKRRHRCTLPSITTTTTDTTTSDYSNGTLDSAEQQRQLSCIDYHFLYADSAPPSDTNDDGSSVAGAVNIEKSSCKAKEHFKEGSKGHSSVRRVASFTYSPQGSSEKHNKRENVSTRKFTLGPIGKTFSYLRHKVDTAISTSALYPTKEECRMWQDSFETLLNHKFGRLLFRQFVKLEFSMENLEFWLECEEYKKMKEGKKQTVQKAQSIFNTYVKDCGIKEVNLDSATKAATKAALESGVRSDIFNLAQTKIEQLMSKDSYQRFLKSDMYLELLNGTPNTHLHVDLLKESENGVILRTSSARESPNKKPGIPYSSCRRHTCVPENTLKSNV